MVWRFRILRYRWEDLQNQSITYAPYDFFRKKHLNRVFQNKNIEMRFGLKAES